MICERCKNEEASIHLTEIIKDIKSEIHLCENCAREIGLNSKLSNFSLSVPEMLSFLDISDIENQTTGHYCKTCGLSYIDYNRDGKLGCPDCYEYFKEELVSSIVSFHGDKKHIGKSPLTLVKVGVNEKRHTADIKINPTEDIYILLEKAVLEERYEDAAVLRDKINDISEE